MHAISLLLMWCLAAILAVEAPPPRHRVQPMNTYGIGSQDCEKSCARVEGHAIDALAEGRLGKMVFNYMLVRYRAADARGLFRFCLDHPLWANLNANDEHAADNDQEIRDVSEAEKEPGCCGTGCEIFLARQIIPKARICNALTDMEYRLELWLADRLPANILDRIKALEDLSTHTIREAALIMTEMGDYQAYMDIYDISNKLRYAPMTAAEWSRFLAGKSFNCCLLPHREHVDKIADEHTDENDKPKDTATHSQEANAPAAHPPAAKFVVPRAHETYFVQPGDTFELPVHLDEGSLPLHFHGGRPYKIGLFRVGTLWHKHIKSVDGGAEGPQTITLSPKDTQKITTGNYILQAYRPRLWHWRIFRIVLTTSPKFFLVRAVV